MFVSVRMCSCACEMCVHQPLYLSMYIHGSRMRLIFIYILLCESLSLHLLFKHL